MNPSFILDHPQPFALSALLLLSFVLPLCAGRTGTPTSRRQAWNGQLAIGFVGLAMVLWPNGSLWLLPVAMVICVLFVKVILQKNPLIMES